MGCCTGLSATASRSNCGTCAIRPSPPKRDAPTPCVLSTRHGYFFPLNPEIFEDFFDEFNVYKVHWVKIAIFFVKGRFMVQGGTLIRYKNGPAIRYKNGPATRYKKGPSIRYIDPNFRNFFKRVPL